MHTHTDFNTYSVPCDWLHVSSWTLCSDTLYCLVGGVDFLGAQLLATVAPGSGLDPSLPPDVLVYTLAPDSDAELRGKDGIHVERRFAVHGRYLSVLLSLSVSGVPRGGGAAGCSDLRTPQAPTPTVPDAQMGQTVSLSASGAEEANSLI